MAHLVMPDLRAMGATSLCDWDANNVRNKEYRILVQARHHFAQQAQLSWYIIRTNGNCDPGVHLADGIRAGKCDRDVMELLNWPGKTFVYQFQFPGKRSVVDIFLPEKVFLLQPLGLNEFGPPEIIKHFRYTPGLQSREPTVRAKFAAMSLNAQIPAPSNSLSSSRGGWGRGRRGRGRGRGRGNARGFRGGRNGNSQHAPPAIISQNGTPPNGALQNDIPPGQASQSQDHSNIVRLRDFLLDKQLPERLGWDKIDQMMKDHKVIGMLSKVQTAIFHAIHMVLETRELLGWETDHEVKAHPNDACVARAAVEDIYVRLCFNVVNAAQMFERSYSVLDQIFPLTSVRSHHAVKAYIPIDWLKAHECAPRLIREVYEVEFGRELTVDIKEGQITDDMRAIERLMLGRIFYRTFAHQSTLAAEGIF